MDSTMQDVELLVSDLLRHGASVHPDATVVHYRDHVHETWSFVELADRAARLAAVLSGLGVGVDDVVATLCWNTPAHLASYFAVPSMGAVLHTLNLRLSDDQLIYIVNHAEDRVVIVDPDLTPQLARILPACPTVTDVLVTGESAADLPRVTVHELDPALRRAEPVAEWPQLDERTPRCSATRQARQVTRRASPTATARSTSTR